MIYLTNAFSLNMLKPGCPAEISVRPLTVQEVVDFDKAADLVSAVGHPDTAQVFSAILGFPVEAHRIDVKLGVQGSLIVGQYSGPRLEEGATELPAGAKIKWFLVDVH